MAVDEAARHHLHQTLDAAIGRDDAVTLMAHLPPSGWADVATVSDLENVELRVGARIDNLELRMDARFAAVTAELVTLESRIETQVAGLELRLVERMRRHDQIIIATLLPLVLSLIGLLATAILRAPVP